MCDCDLAWLNYKMDPVTATHLSDLHSAIGKSPGILNLLCKSWLSHAPPSTHPLVVLLLLDLLHLLHQLSHSQLQLAQLVFGSDFCIVVRMLTYLDIKVNSLGMEKRDMGVRQSCCL